jgi:AcrR family transcriptional regulator
MTITTASRPKRADALRNYEKLIAAARAAFTEAGTAASLEDIARRAGVGIGTLYRHFPTRQALLEAVYVDEVDTLCRSAEEVAGDPPWEALVAWLRRFVEYVGTKQALAEELFADGRNSEVFKTCHAAFSTAGKPLLARAQEAAVVRPDAEFEDVVRMIAGIAKMPETAPGQTERMLEMALDGLRYRAPSPE